MAVVEKEKMEKSIIVNYELLFKKLLMMNQMGVYLQGADGHVWISEDREVDYPLILENVMLNNKIYGGVIQAIETFDEALLRDGKDSLISNWDEGGHSILFLGTGGIDTSRIDKVKKGQGGIY